MPDLSDLQKEADDQQERALVLIAEAGRLIDDLKSTFDQLKELTRDDE